MNEKNTCFCNALNAFVYNEGELFISDVVCLVDIGIKINFGK